MSDSDDKQLRLIEANPLAAGQDACQDALILALVRALSEPEGKLKEGPRCGSFPSRLVPSTLTRISWPLLLRLVWTYSLESLSFGRTSCRLLIYDDKPDDDGRNVYKLPLDDGRIVTFREDVLKQPVFARLFSDVEKMSMWLSFPFDNRRGVVNEVRILSEDDVQKAVAAANMPGALDALERGVPIDDVIA